MRHEYKHGVVDKLPLIGFNYGILHHVSHEKRAPGWLGYIGDEKLPSYIGDYFINHYKDPVINQPGFNGK